MKYKKILCPITAFITAATMLCACSEKPEKEESRAETVAETTSVVTTTEAVTTTTEVTQETEEPYEETTAQETFELYDTAPISDAYLSGDTTELDELQLKILDEAKKVINENITEDMDEYTKEMVIHDYLITHCTYDTQMLSVVETPQENSDNPYGALVNGEGICSGYTTSFQMFMDMLGIPCTSVKGCDIKGEEHAWNMVQLGGHWYYVDVTWDDPVPDKHTEKVMHLFFNTTEEAMSEEHVWDKESCPPTDSLEDTYISHNIRTIYDWNEINDVINDAMADNTLTAFVEPDESLGADMSKADGVVGYGSGMMISKELSEIYKEQAKSNPECGVIFKRTKFGDKIVIEIYLSPKVKKEV